MNFSRALMGLVAFAILGGSACSTSDSQNKGSAGLSSSRATESHRVLIDNREGGEIRGSRDGGQSWLVLGHVTVPMKGGVWYPTQDAGVLAFNFLRGPSSVFASAVNAIHLRFSDPEGYKLPSDVHEALVIPHGVSIVPKESFGEVVGAPGGDRAALTDIPGGTGIFGAAWSPKVGSRVLLTKEAKAGEKFLPIPYDVAPNVGNQILIVTDRDEAEIDYLEFDNVAGGQVRMKRVGEAVKAVAKVTQAVEGVGRFTGSEWLQKPGQIRANHAGVLDIGTTDINVDPARPIGGDINELRGGFQVVPSYHYADHSMVNGGDHPFVYMVVAPLAEPVGPIERYDQGVEGRYPLFFGGLRGGVGRTYFKFKGGDQWIELADAIQAGKFTRKDGSRVDHLRGYIRDALINVTAIRLVNDARPVANPDSVTPEWRARLGISEVTLSLASTPAAEFSAQLRELRAACEALRASYENVEDRAPVMQSPASFAARVESFKSPCGEGMRGRITLNGCLLDEAGAEAGEIRRFLVLHELAHEVLRTRDDLRVFWIEGQGLSEESVCDLAGLQISNS